MRTRQPGNVKLILTKEQVADYERALAKEFAMQEAVQRGMDVLRLSAAQVEKHRRLLARQFTVAEPSMRDVFWSLAGHELVAALRTDDWHRVKMIYFSQALLLHEEGRPFFRLLQEASKAELRRYESQGLKRVSILAGECPACRVNADRVFTVPEALRLLPIPRADCHHDGGWCRCTWSPVVG